MSSSLQEQVILLVTVVITIGTLVHCHDDDLVTITNTDGPFVVTGHCKKSQACRYDYFATVGLHEGEKANVTAKIGLFCDSVGLYEAVPATRYCITVKDVSIISISNDTNKREIMNISNAKLSKSFCFVQSTVSGKILHVFYPKDEKAVIINFKKGIVSSFQANYKGSTKVHETDTQSEHISHYKYTVQGDRQIQQRRVSQDDVKKFASHSKEISKSISFQQEEELELDQFNVIHSSKGQTVIEIKSGDDVENNEETEVEREESSNTAARDFPKIGATSRHSMILVKCMHISKMKKRSVPLKEKHSLIDSLLIKRNEVIEDIEDMKELNDDILSVHDTVNRVQRDTETGQLLHKWRRLLEMEYKHGPLPGTQAKLPLLISTLQQSKVIGNNVSIERTVLYHLLSVEGSLEAQKALIGMLHKPITEEERTTLLIEISLLSSVHISTIDSFIDYYEKLMDSDNDISNQCILTLGTLGRHLNVQEKVVNYLIKKLNTAKNDTSNIILYIHGLGNTGSVSIIPILVPYLHQHLDISLQLITIDALRTVSLEKRVQDSFINVIKNAIYPEQVITVIESLSFPYKHSVYYTDHTVPGHVDQSLIDVLLDTADKLHDNQLNVTLSKYLSLIKYTATGQGGKRHRRSSSHAWDSDSNTKFNKIETLSMRANDEMTYPFNQGFLWTRKLGVKRLNAKITDGGFAGVGTSGGKAYARGLLELYVYKKTFTVADVLFSYVGTLPDSNSQSTLTIIRYAKLAGTVYINHRETITKKLSYTKSWSVSRRLFHVRFRFPFAIGTAKLYLTGNLNCQTKFTAFAVGTELNATLPIVPSISVTGGGRVTLLAVYRAGIEATATIGYRITPHASVAVCDAYPKGDATACYGVHTQPVGTLSVYAYTQRRSIRCRWVRCRIRWKRKKKSSRLSKTWNLINRPPRLLTGSCRVCDCHGNHFLNTICNGKTTAGRRYCTCNTQRYPTG